MAACRLAYASAGLAGNTSGNSNLQGYNLTLATFNFQVPSLHPQSVPFSPDFCPCMLQISSDQAHCWQPG